MDAANAALADAVARREEIARLLIEARAAVEADREDNEGIRGRPTVPRRNKTARLKGAVSRLENGLLPGEHQQVDALPAGALAASARANAQHHAQAEPLPSGRPRAPSQLNGSSDAARTAAGNGGSDSSSGNDHDAPDADTGDDDDDSEDPNFKQYYHVSADQKAFNEESGHAYLKGEVDRKVTRIVPPKVLPSGCNPELVGVGAFNMHAPHLEMGLPLPPCPRCGWKSVDSRRVSTNGVCPARRVYASETDEWVGGLHMQCGICRAQKQKLKDTRDEIVDDDESTEEEREEAEAAVKAMTYCYRSYNPPEKYNKSGSTDDAAALQEATDEHTAEKVRLDAESNAAKAAKAAAAATKRQRLS